MKQVPTHPITFEEFLDWCDSETRAEWVNGKVVLMSPASRPHQDIGSFLEALLRIYVQRHKLGVIVRAPFLMHLRKVKSAREPDVLYVSHEHAAQLKHTYLDGPADLAVEIMSPESIERDREDKMREYSRSGIREYWLIDPMHRTAEFFERRAEGRYRRIQLEDEGVFYSRVIVGFHLRLAWLWQDPMPEIPDIARELGVWSLSAGSDGGR